MANALYNWIFKRSSTFAVAILVGSFFFERSFDLISDQIFENVNKGKLWKDIKHKYEQ
ncbi:Cytochrome b-c1 complex subunit 9 [Habropoda laboriosa]|uniref:Complex III subunit 9 n=1 Tax=Habropoda laboriosa TaxID=597456 RepID=A0A0L7RBD1_9HYME|nr:PREDICTED: cytochrome b-c1 complex subunit 9 [Habropoda laboriosa]KOC68056.1 Cytochrome b-c1 complex subunit 9 [Habropoda laboriosa]